MKRQAILIGAPGKEYTNKHLKGVDLDIKNYIKFLQSPTGGAWEKSEIIPIKNPESDKLINIIQQSDADYLLTVFSGHGAYTHKGQTILAINRTQFLTLQQLISNVPKQMFIIDACRSFIDSGFANFLGEELRTFPSRLTKAHSKLLFNSYLKKCDDGIVICYSASVGQASFDTNDGGYFTTSLLDTTKRWVEKPSKFNILPIHHAFTKTQNYIARHLTKEQTPQLKASNKRVRWFPFAIRKADELFWD